ncbi:hypothetical protein RUND412_007465 [Rhizina undulata]
MSRHKLVRNLDLSEELADYDEYDDDDELNEEDERALAEGLKTAREILGSDIKGLTDDVIKESLWYYYFDVAKTINYLLNKYTKPAPAPKKKAEKKPESKVEKKVEKKDEVKKKDLVSVVSDIGQGPWNVFAASSAFPYSGLSLQTKPKTATELGFFLDAPWGNIPEYRRATILVEPIYPRGGLLGGAPPKTSKLAALAKARKEKAAAEKTQAGAAAEEQKTSLALLSRLSKKEPTPTTSSAETASSSEKATLSKQTSLPITATQEKALANLARATIPGESNQDLDQSIPPPEKKDNIPDKNDIERLCGQPSKFAMSMFGERIETACEISITNGRMIFVTGNLTSDGKNPFTEPSPDDVVLAAQSGSKSLGPKGMKKDTKSPKAADKGVQDVAQGVQDIDISSAPPPVKFKKRLDVLEEFKKSKPKENANFVVIGHVDAGKSTLMGRLLLDLGVIDERTVQKFRQEADKIGKSSFALAWVLDQTNEERKRGVTMDIAVNKFETEKSRFTILDAPGHRDFIPNMIAGASQADFAVLVIDSAINAFEAGFNLSGQTKEHTLLVRSMGVQRIIVAINKLDTVDWSHERFEEIELQMTTFLTAAGFHRKNISFVPCSGLSGENILRKPTKGLMPWYKGGTLVDELERSKPLTRAIEKPLRLTITDVFKGGIMNPVSVSGRIDAGCLQASEIVVAMPSGEIATIKAIEVDEEPADWAVAGMNVVLHLSGIDMIHLRAGDIICDQTSRVHPLHSFNVKLLAFESLTPMMVDVHRGRLHVGGKISYLLSTIDKTTGKVLKQRPRHVGPGALASVKVEVLGDAIPLEKDMRVVLRTAGKTVAAGIVE